MRTDGLVVLPPGFDLAPWVVERNEGVLAETHLAQARIEGFAVRVPDRFSWIKAARIGPRRTRGCQVRKQGRGLARCRAQMRI